MAEKRFIFAEFELDPGERRLTKGGEGLSVSGRYFDALALLVENAGRLVSKDRFMEEVWGGAAVTDEVLTQCVRSLRRHLGDSASNPQFIETVPGHGYRFIAEVRPASELESDLTCEPAAAPQPKAEPGPDRLAAILTPAWPAALGGAAAGVAGGLVYGALISAGAAGSGAVSALLVVIAVCAGIGLIAGLGVGLGLGAAHLFPGPPPARLAAGGALGGCLVGALFKLVGVDAFTLLFGVGLPGMTGGGEGLLLGLAAGLGVHLAQGPAPAWRSILLAAVAGAAAGFVLHLLGGRLMAGSLALLLDTAPGARLDLSALGALTGEAGFGPHARGVTAMFEGALFTGLIAAALHRAVERRRAARAPQGS